MPSPWVVQAIFFDSKTLGLTGNSHCGQKLTWDCKVLLGKFMLGSKSRLVQNWSLMELVMVCTVGTSGSEAWYHCTVSQCACVI